MYKYINIKIKYKNQNLFAILLLVDSCRSRTFSKYRVKATNMEYQFLN